MLELEVPGIDKWKQTAPKRICKSIWYNFCLRVVLKRSQAWIFFKKSRVSVYLLMMNQQSCMAAKWVFQCTASFFLLSPRRVSEMEKNKALNFSEAKSGKMCVIH